MSTQSRDAGHGRPHHAPPHHTHLPALEEYPDTEPRVVSSVPSPAPKEQARVKKSPAVLGLVILVPLLTLAFVAILWAQQEQIDRLEGDLVAMDAALTETRAQNAFYKKAFEITLDDMRIVSQTFGGEDRYAQLARDLREKEIGTVLGVETSKGNYSLRNPQLWGEYESKGTVNTSCLPPSVAADTITDEILVTITWASASNASFYVDGNYLTTLLPGRSRFTVLLPNGMHEMDLIAKGAGSIQEFYVDTVSIPADAFIEDTGSSWTVFDCKGTTPGASTGGQGALRVRVEKR